MSGSDYDSGTIDFVIIKCVQRLTTLHQNVIRCVHNVVDALILLYGAIDFPFPENRLQSLDQPIRTGTNLYSLDDPGSVAWTGLFKLVFNGQQLTDVLSGTLQTRFRTASGQSIQDTNFASDTDVPQTVSSITRYFKIDHHVIVDMVCSLVIESGQTESLSKFFVTHRQANIFGQPFE